MKAVSSALPPWPSCVCRWTLAYRFRTVSRVRIWLVGGFGMDTAPAVTVPSTTIVLKMFPPMLNTLPGLTSTLPWINAPTGGIDTVMIVFATLVKLSVRTFEPVPVPLGGWLTRPRLRPMIEIGAVGELMLPPTLSRFRSRPM